MANENIITSENLEQIPPVPLADNTVDTSIYDTSTVLADLTALQEKARTDVEALQKEGKQESSSIADLQSLMGGKEAETVKTYADTGVTKLYEQLTDIGVQAEGLKREQLAIPHQLQEQIAGTGTTERGLAPQTAGALRRNALKALTLGQQAAIAGAQYDKAKNYADQIISAKYAQYEADIVAKKTNLEALREFDLSPAEEKLRVATLAKISKEESILEQQKLTEQRVYDEEIAEKKGRKDDVLLYAKYAMEAGQSDIASQINSLDPNSDTFAQDLAKLQSQIKDPMVALEISIKKQQLALSQAQTAKVYKETGLLGEPTAKETKATEDAIKTAKASIPVMQDKINAVDALLIAKGMEFRVGATRMQREGMLMGLPGVAGVGTSVPSMLSERKGEGQKFSGGIHKLVSGLSIDSLIAAKARGATFGALSDNELKMLADAATSINDWEIVDKQGKGTGYWNIDEESFREELTRIQELTKRAMILSGEQLFSDDESSILDETFDSTDLSAESYFE